MKAIKQVKSIKILRLFLSGLFFIFIFNTSKGQNFTCPNEAVYFSYELISGTVYNLPNGENCSINGSGGNGENTYQTLRISFFSDPAKTIPLNVINYPCAINNEFGANFPGEYNGYTSSVPLPPGGTPPLNLRNGTFFEEDVLINRLEWQDGGGSCVIVNTIVGFKVLSNCLISDGLGGIITCSKTFETAATKTLKCVNESIVLSITNPNNYPGGITPYFNTFQWYRNGSIIPTATNTTYTTTTPGTYYCNATDRDIYGNIFCTTNTTPINVVDQTLTTTLTNTALVVCEPTTVQLCATATGSGYTYEWTDGTNSLPSSTNPCVTWTNPGTVNLYCNIVTPLGCLATTESKTIIINPLPINTVQATYSGSNVELCSYEIAAGSTYQWYKNNSTIPSATARCYTATSNGNYYCYVTTPQGCSRYSDTTLIVGLLAVKILEIKGAKLENEINKIEWKLSNLVDYKSLIIEISYNGSTYTELFKSNSSNVLKYEHKEDRQAYYRLKIINKDESISFSKVVFIPSSKTNDFNKVYPNPTGNNTTLFIQTNTAQTALVHIFDSKGALIKSENISLSKGKNIHILSLITLKGGMYKLTIIGKTINQSISLFKN